MNKKQVIRINENQLRQIVTESVKRALKEATYLDDIEKFLPHIKETYGKLKNIHDNWFYGDYNPKGMEKVLDLISDAMAELDIMIRDSEYDDIPTGENPHIHY